jgi:hypothetical protein
MPPRTIPDEDRLFPLACHFRSTRDENERRVIAQEYAETVHRLIQTGRWDQGPALDAMLPDEWMPQTFFDYWLSPESAASHRGHGRITVDHATIAKGLRLLLVMYEGVTIDRLRTHPSGHATVTLRITSPASVARLACWATNSNIGCSVWGDSRGTTEGEWASPDRVRYELRAEPEPEGAEPPSAVQMFCNHLIDDLRDRGHLSEGEATRLLNDLDLGERTV